MYFSRFESLEKDQLLYTDFPDFINKSEKSKTDLTSQDLTIEELKEVIIIPKTDENVKIEKVQELKSKPIYVKKPIGFSSILYDNEREILNEANTSEIQRIVTLMLTYPELNILLTSHIPEGGRIDYDLYMSILRAEKIGDYISSKGISPHRILLNGCGGNFPVQKQDLKNKNKLLLNQRIDIQFSVNETSENVLKISYPVIEPHLRDPRWDEFRGINTELSFRVRFSKLGQMLKSRVLGLRNDVIVEKRGQENFYTYTMGNFTTFDQALRLKKELLINNMDGSEIIAYYKGFELTETEITSLIKKYPELYSFITASKD